MQLTPKWRDRIKDLANSNKACLMKMAASSGPQLAIFYNKWSKGDLIVYLLEHHWPEEE